MHKNTRSTACTAYRPDYKIAMLALTILGSAFATQAAEVPNTFSAGTPARAAEVNANFDAVTEALTTAEGEIDALQTSASDAENEIDALQTSVTALEADTGALGDGKVAKDGDVMTGTLTVPQLDYSTPRTHYYAVSGDAFRSLDSNAGYRCGGRGGCYVTTAGYTGGLSAALDLPDGAVIRSFTTHLLDENATRDLTVYFYYQRFAGAYSQITPSVSSTGESTDTQVVSRDLNYVVDNLGGALRIVVGAGEWPGDSSMIIRGVVVEYELASAL